MVDGNCLMIPAEEYSALLHENEMLKRTIEILDQEGVDKCNKLESQANKIKHLEKALDKACQELENFCDTYECYVPLQKEPHHKDDWKKWCMKEEEQ